MNKKEIINTIEYNYRCRGILDTLPESQQDNFMALHHVTARNYGEYVSGGKDFYPKIVGIAPTLEGYRYKIEWKEPKDFELWATDMREYIKCVAHENISNTYLLLGLQAGRPGRRRLQKYIELNKRNFNWMLEALRNIDTERLYAPVAHFDDVKIAPNVIRP